jgi:hypothetical protein
VGGEGGRELQEGGQFVVFRQAGRTRPAGARAAFRYMRLGVRARKRPQSAKLPLKAGCAGQPVYIDQTTVQGERQCIPAAAAATRP